MKLVVDDSQRWDKQSQTYTATSHAIVVLWGNFNNVFSPVTVSVHIATLLFIFPHYIPV